MSHDIQSQLQLESFTIRRFDLEVSDEPDGETHEASVSLSYDFFRHASEANKYRIVLNIEAHSGEDNDKLFRLVVASDAFVAVPVDADEETTQVLLTNGVALLYSTLRGSIASVVGQTPLRGFVLPAIDMNAVVRAVAQAQEEAADPDAEA